MKVDLYFSFRSPYSYLILPRMVELRDKHGVDVNFKQVYPLAIREPEFFKGKNLFTYFLIRRIDYVRQAKKNNMVFVKPNPDPINQNLLTGKFLTISLIFLNWLICVKLLKKVNNLTLLL